VIKDKIPKLRKVWIINPKTRIKKSDKIYKRKKEKDKVKKEIQKILDEECP